VTGDAPWTEILCRFAFADDINELGENDIDSLWFLASRRGNARVMQALLAAGGDLARSLRAAVGEDDTH